MELNQPPPPSQDADSDFSQPVFASTSQPLSSDTATQAEITAETNEALYAAIAQYPFLTDPEYQLGLAAILGHPETPATHEEVANNEELVIQAQCFYIARRFDTSPVDPAAYRTWLQRKTEDARSSVGRTPSKDVTLEQDTFLNGTAAGVTTSAAPPSNSTDSIQPPYPTSFAEIVDLITQNKPIPGIETVPDTVLEPGTSKVDKTQRRQKPWETAAAAAAIDTNDESSTDTNNTEIASKKSEGVVRILQPGAIPDSGLVSSD